MKMLRYAVTSCAILCWATNGACAADLYDYPPPPPHEAYAPPPPPPPPPRYYYPDAYYLRAASPIPVLCGLPLLGAWLRIWASAVVACALLGRPFGWPLGPSLGSPLVMLVSARAISFSFFPVRSCWVRCLKYAALRDKRAKNEAVAAEEDRIGATHSRDSKG